MAPYSRSKPLIDLKYMHFFRIPGTYDSEQTIEIYGTIVVCDDNNDESCEIYNHPKTHPQLITPSVNTLDFTEPVDTICFMYEPVVHVDLKNCVDDSVIILASQPIENPASETEDGRFDRYDSVHIQSDLGYLIIHYSSLAFGVVAQVEVKLEKEHMDSKEDVDVEDSPIEIVNVSGRISASSRGTYGANYLSYHTLFHRELSDEPEAVSLGSAMTLSREFIAVPLYTDLVIELGSLLNHDTQKPLASKNLTFRPYNSGACYWDTKGKGSGEVYVNVRVGWHQPYLLCLSAGLNEEYHYVPDFMRMPSVGMMGRPLAEIFSAVIGVQGDKLLAVYGTVCFDCMLREHVMFSREKKNALLLPSRLNLLPLSRPRNFVWALDPYNVHVDLTDKFGNASIKETFNSPLGWKHGDPTLFNRRLCSVIRGQGAFMALHYIAFSKAVIADVQVLVYPCGSGVGAVYGEVIASYGDHEYQTPYDMKFYRSWLFSTSKEKAVQLVKDVSPALLCRSTVPVSTDTSLVIEIKLHALDGSMASDDSSGGTIHHKFEFPINKWGPRIEKIDRGSFTAGVNVNWFSRH